MGSVYRRKSDGYYVGQYRIETINGHKTKCVYAKSEREARRKLKQAETEAAKQGPVVADSGGLTVERFLSDWLEGVKPTIKHSAWLRHEQSARLHINPAIGTMKLDKVTPLHLQRLYTAKLDAGLAPRSVRIIHATLHKAFKQAENWSLVHKNVAAKVSPPKPEDEEINPLSKEEVKLLLDAARGDRLEALYVLAITTGMREGELLGLKYEDLDLESGILRVQRTVSNGVSYAPKTKHSRRTIKLPSKALEALRAHVEGTGWLFPTKNGRPIQANNFINRHWSRLLRKAGLPYCRFHLLRHSAATLLLDSNVNPKHVQQLLGHADISTTMNIYSHHTRAMDSKTSEAMDDILGEEDE